MKLAYYYFLSSSFLCSASAALDCNTQAASRNAKSVSVCDHFQGVDAGPYRDWFSEKEIETRYTGTTYLRGSDPGHPENGAAIHWKIEGDYVHLAVAARATGWVAFGIAEAGGMLGADMALFEAAKPNEIVDAYTTDEFFPQVDDCKSDWELLASHVDEENGFLMVEFKRLLQHDDPQDKNIFDDASTLVPPHRVIAAWGDTTEVSYHGLNRGRGVIRFYGTGDDKATFDKAMEEQAEGSFIVSSIDHEISVNETEYAYTCFSREDLIAQGVPNTTDLVNVIGFDPIIQEGNEAYVHHYIIYGDPNNDCRDGNFDELAYIWAPGDGGVNLPDNLGAPLFGDDGFQAYLIEVHYNNPLGTPGIIDSSGVLVYWTSQPREHQIGILSTGDPVVELYNEPVGDGKTVHSFDCPDSCSSLALSDQQPVTVLREYLHMHATGTRIVNEQIRDGNTIRQGSVDYWEFQQNGNAAVQQAPFDIQPGDAFKTTCFFNGNGRKFGLGSSDEMCIAFFYYYPRKIIVLEEYGISMPWFCAYDSGFFPCDTVYQKEVLPTADNFGRVFGASAEDICEVTASSDGGISEESGDGASGDTNNGASEDSSDGVSAVLSVVVVVAATVVSLVI